VFRVTFVPTAGEWTRLRTASSAAQLINYFSDDKIKKNEMAGSCSTYGAEERYIQGFDGETWEEECNLKA
jgi:hypothetical protein